MDTGRPGQVPVAGVIALVALGTALSVGAVALLSRANRGRPMRLVSSRGVRMPFPALSCRVAAVAVFIAASDRAADVESLPFGAPLGLLLFLLFGIEVLGRAWHDRRLRRQLTGSQPPMEERRRPVS